MVDIELCRNLFSALNDETQLILVGDIDQLPSVGPGDVLRDLMSAFPNKIIRLDQIFRQAETSLIVSNAHKKLTRDESQRPRQTHKVTFSLLKKMIRWNV